MSISEKNVLSINYLIINKKWHKIDSRANKIRGDRGVYVIKNIE